MIPVRYRLNLRQQPNFFIHAKRYYADFFTMFYKQTTNDCLSQLAVVVPKKIIKKRVVRSKIKRRIYHAALPSLENKLGLSLVFVVKKNFLKLKFEEVVIEIEKIFNNLIQND